MSVGDRTRDGDLCLLPHLAWACAGPVCPASLCEFIGASDLLCLEGLVSLVSALHPPPPPCVLPASSSFQFPEPRGEGFEEDHLALSVPVVGLCICPRLLQEKASLMMAEQGARIYKGRAECHLCLHLCLCEAAGASETGVTDSL